MKRPADVRAGGPYTSESARSTRPRAYRGRRAVLPPVEAARTSVADRGRDGRLPLVNRPAALSRFGTTDRRYRVQCCMLGTIRTNLHAALIYQGEEIGMVNVPWTSVDQLRDVEILKSFVNDCRVPGIRGLCRLAMARSRRNNAAVPCVGRQQKQRLLPPASRG